MTFVMSNGGLLSKQACDAVFHSIHLKCHTGIQIAFTCVTHGVLVKTRKRASNQRVECCDIHASLQETFLAFRVVEQLRLYHVCSLSSDLWNRQLLNDVELFTPGFQGCPGYHVCVTTEVHGIDDQWIGLLIWLKRLTFARNIGLVSESSCLQTISSFWVYLCIIFNASCLPQQANLSSHYVWPAGYLLSSIGLHGKITQFPMSNLSGPRFKPSADVQLLTQGVNIEFFLLVS